MCWLKKSSAKNRLIYLCAQRANHAPKRTMPPDAMRETVRRAVISVIVHVRQGMGATARVRPVRVLRAMVADREAGPEVAPAGHGHPDAMAKRGQDADHRWSL